MFYIKLHTKCTLILLFLHLFNTKVEKLIVFSDLSEDLCFLIPIAIMFSKAINSQNQLIEHFEGTVEI